MKMLLNGAWMGRERVMPVRDPQDGTIIDTVPEAKANDMRAAIDAAQRAVPCAKALPVHERMRILDATADYVAARHEEYALTIAREGVKTIREARKEVTRGIETLRISAEEARRLGGETIPFDQRAGSENRVGYFFREPIGIVGALTPFNDPLNLVAHKIGPATAAGNVIIVKPHKELSFIGGSATGQAILRQAGLKKIAMKLGSNSPVIVMPDADLDLAVDANVSGAFWAAGQNCLHVQRLLVHENIYAEFAARFVAAAEKYRVGNKLDETTDMGPLINAAAAQRVEHLVEQAVARGARVLSGGERSGNFYAPTVLETEVGDARLACAPTV